MKAKFPYVKLFMLKIISRTEIAANDAILVGVFFCARLRQQEQHPIEIGCCFRFLERISEWRFCD